MELNTYTDSKLVAIYYMYYSFFMTRTKTNLEEIISSAKTFLAKRPVLAEDRNK